jgi:hypothetical protein
MGGALPQQSGALGFGDLAVADIADRAGDQQAFLGVQGAQTDFDRKFGAILPTPVQL